MKKYIHFKYTHKSHFHRSLWRSAIPSHRSSLSSQRPSGNWNSIISIIDAPSNKFSKTRRAFYQSREVFYDYFSVICRDFLSNQQCNKSIQSNLNNFHNEPLNDLMKRWMIIYFLFIPATLFGDSDDPSGTVYFISWLRAGLNIKHLNPGSTIKSLDSSVAPADHKN